MTADRMAEAIARRSRNHNRRARPAGRRHLSRAPLAQDELDDKARWLEGQVQGWRAARTL
jgi:hypothetical protein